MRISPSVEYLNPNTTHKFIQTNRNHSSDHKPIETMNKLSKINLNRLSKIKIKPLSSGFLWAIIVLAQLSIYSSLKAQTVHHYTISFEQAKHHEARISVEFPNIDEQPFQVRMSRTSPGRYAIHNFAKNVYDVQAYDKQGNELEIIRPNPQQWDVGGHDGFVRFEYTLFANRGDGTYSQIDETHAHLNIPATFVYARNYPQRPIELDIKLPKNSGWKVATQLRQLSQTLYFAPDFYYFMDSPIEISDYHLRERMVDGQLIQLALHTPASDREVNEYFAKVMAIVEAQREVFGELPEFDFGRYTFLSCYMPQASRDGMEHRNSTIVTNAKPTEEPLANTSISTISHEFFHAWSVERLRPVSLEPFDFEEANMSGALWFAEGFTSYYTNLILARAGVIAPDEYVEGLARTLNYVMLSPGSRFFSPIEMSYRAPFVDAATAIDPDNNDNIFISYYSYGSMLGLALDLTLRTETETTLDEYMRTLWQQYGRNEQPYSIKDLESTLASVAGDSLADGFFARHIYSSEMPDLQQLLGRVGVELALENDNQPYLGPSTRWVEEDKSYEISSVPQMGSPAYEAGLRLGDRIVSIDGLRVEVNRNPNSIIESKRVGQVVDIDFTRWGMSKNVRVELKANPRMKTERVRRPSRSETVAFGEWIPVEQ